jgi:small subunit ribosomal protein S11
MNRKIKKFNSKIVKTNKNQINLVIRVKTRNLVLSVTTNKNGNLIFWYSSGLCGFKGTRKKTGATLFTLVDKVARKLKSEFGCFVLNLVLKGQSNFRPALKALKSQRIKIFKVINTTSIPFNGTDYSKKRRKKNRTRRKRHLLFRRLITVVHQQHR